MRSQVATVRMRVVWSSFETHTDIGICKNVSVKVSLPKAAHDSPNLLVGSAVTFSYPNVRRCST